MSATKPEIFWGRLTPSFFKSWIFVSIVMCVVMIGTFLNSRTGVYETWRYIEVGCFSIAALTFLGTRICRSSYVLVDEMLTIRPAFGLKKNIDLSSVKAIATYKRSGRFRGGVITTARYYCLCYEGKGRKVTSETRRNLPTHVDTTELKEVALPLSMIDPTFMRVLGKYVEKYSVKIKNADLESNLIDEANQKNKKPTKPLRRDIIFRRYGWLITIVFLTITIAGIVGETNSWRIANKKYIISSDEITRELVKLANDNVNVPHEKKIDSLYCDFQQKTPYNCSIYLYGQKEVYANAFILDKGESVKKNARFIYIKGTNDKK
ncbi:MAG: hypothetical protein U0R17_04110 [Acidimicrobiia bacterium]